MALKAGYNGIKKSVLDKLLQMSGALIIKSLGTALSLSDAGELRVRNASDSHSGVVQPDGETTFIEGGLLKAASSGYTKDVLYDPVTNPVTDNTSYSFGEDLDVNDYDVIGMVLTTVQDGGISSTQWQFVSLTDFLKLSTGWSICLYKERWARLSIDFTDNSFKFESAAVSESGNYKPVLCYIYGIKF